MQLINAKLQHYLTGLYSLKKYILISFTQSRYSLLLLASFKDKQK